MRSLRSVLAADQSSSRLILFTWLPPSAGLRALRSACRWGLRDVDPARPRPRLYLAHPGASVSCAAAPRPWAPMLDTEPSPMRPCGMHANDIRPAPPAAHQIELQEPEPDQVRAARKCAGHTQTQAGQLVGGTLRTWQDWESGKRAMPAATLALYLLLTDQHPDMRLTRKKSRSGG